MATMATSDTSEKALETLIVDGLCANGWKRGSNADYKPEFALDLEQLRAFIRETQPALEIALDLASDTPTRKKFLDRLVKEITNRGVIDVLRNGVKHGPHDVALFYGAPSRGTRQRQRRTKRTGSPSSGSSTTASPSLPSVLTCA